MKNKDINIILTGDIIEIQNILSLPKFSSIYGRTSIIPEDGGVKHLEKIINAFFNDEYKENIKSIKLDYSAYNKIINIWSPHDLSLIDKEIKVWRIENEIGKQKVIKKAHNDLILNKEEINIINKYNMGFKELLNDSIKEYSLVFNDQHLNFDDIYKEIFTNNKSSFFHEFVLSHKIKNIYLKTSLSDNQNDLLNYFADNDEIAKKTTIIFDSNSFRRKNGLFDTNGSWNKIYGSLIKEIENGLIKNYFSKIKRLIIYFKYAGFALINLSSYNKTEDQALQLFFDPEEIDESWINHYPGITRGDLEIITASLIHSDYYKYSEFIAFKNALKIIRIKHLLGRGKYTFNEIKTWGYNEDQLQNKIKTIMKPYNGNLDIINSENEDSDFVYPYLIEINEKFDNFNLKINSNFYCTINNDSYELIKKMVNIPPLSLLEMYLGSSYERIIYKGSQIIENGYQDELDSIPFLKIQDSVTYDQKEIENINIIKNLIHSYIDIKSPNFKPLSITIFGPPGIGKSFYLRSIAQDKLFDLPIVNINLSQINNTDELINSIEMIKNIPIQKKIPLIIWDEFDCNNFKWLKYFLEPIQDGFFSIKGQQHYIGKSIFVFIGSVFSSFGEFVKNVQIYNLQNYYNNENNIKRESDNSQFLKPIEKGSDFSSRIKAYLDLQSINPEFKTSKGLSKLCYHDTFQNNSHIIRRAILIRNLIERFYPNIINHANNKARICPSISQAFLRSQRFYYEARSIETILQLSNISNNNYYTISDLPPLNLLKNNVSSDFIEYLKIYKIKYYNIDSLVSERHNKWFNLIQKTNKEIKPYKIRLEDDKYVFHPAFTIKHKDIDIKLQIINNRSIGLFLGNIADLGILLVEKESQEKDNKNILSEKSDKIKAYLKYKLSHLEHETWLDEQIKIGWINKPLNSINLNFNVNQRYMIDENIDKFTNLNEEKRAHYFKKIEHLLDYLEKMKFLFSLGYDLGIKLKIGFIFSTEEERDFLSDEETIKRIIYFITDNYKFNKNIEPIFCNNNLYHNQFKNRFMNNYFSRPISKQNIENDVKLSIADNLIQPLEEDSKCICNYLNQVYSPCNKPCIKSDCCHLINTANIIFYSSTDLEASSYLKDRNNSDDNFKEKYLFNNEIKEKYKINEKLPIDYKDIINTVFLNDIHNKSLKVAIKLYNNTLYFVN